MANRTINSTQKTNHCFYFVEGKKKVNDTVFVYLILNEIELLPSIWHRSLWWRLSPWNEWDLQVAGRQGSIEMNGTAHLCCVLTQARVVHLCSPGACSAHCPHQRGAPGKDGGMVVISHPHLPRLPVPLGVGSLWVEPGRRRISSTAKVFTAVSEQTCNTHRVKVEEANYALK